MQQFIPNPNGEADTIHDNTLARPFTNHPNIPPRQADVVGYHEALAFGGNHLHDNILKLVKQSYKVGTDCLNGVSSILGSSSFSYREWALVTIATLATMGDTRNQLNVYVEGALRHGVSADEILDLLHHQQGFVGNPRSINALRSVWPQLEQHIKTPETYTESLIRIGDHDTMVRDTHGGTNGPNNVPIICIHALSLDGRMFKDVLPALHTATGARVISYDMRGHGYARGAPLTKGFSTLTTDLLTLLDTLSIPVADIYGASYGGAVAQYFALDHRTRVRSISPISISARSTPVLADRGKRAEEAGTTTPFIAETLTRWFSPETLAVNPWSVRYARHCVERARVQEWSTAWRTMSTLETLPRLPELTDVPVLALSGSGDLSSTPPLMKEISDAAPLGEFVNVENGSHMMVMDQWEDVADALIAFRTKVDSGKKKEN